VLDHPQPTYCKPSVTPQESIHYNSNTTSAGELTTEQLTELGAPYQKAHMKEEMRIHQSMVVATFL
jgi:hypothetical protein